MPSDTIRNIRQAPFFWCDNAILDEDYAEAIGPYGMAVYITLCRYADDGGICWPAVGTIARKWGMSENAVRAGIKKLVAAGLIAVEERADAKGGAMSNRYTLLPVQRQTPHSSHAGGGLHQMQGGASRGEGEQHLITKNPQEARAHACGTANCEPSALTLEQYPRQSALAAYCHDRYGKALWPLSVSAAQLTATEERLAELDTLVALVTPAGTTWLKVLSERLDRPTHGALLEESDVPTCYKAINEALCWLLDDYRDKAMRAQSRGPRVDAPPTDAPQGCDDEAPAAPRGMSDDDLATKAVYDDLAGFEQRAKLDLGIPWHRATPAQRAAVQAQIDAYREQLFADATARGVRV